MKMIDCTEIPQTKLKNQIIQCLKTRKKELDNNLLKTSKIQEILHYEYHDAPVIFEYDIQVRDKGWK